MDPEKLANESPRVYDPWRFIHMSDKHFYSSIEIDDQVRMSILCPSLQLQSYTFTFVMYHTPLFV